ncbi:polymorphic toxin-type HINT domain-containing protein [Leptospira montravelensis]|nr:polymorphic toxin-type HINT domain-containing protein [Leptospira montravelensis]
MAVLQTLDSLWSLPLTFEATIKEQNKALDEQLTMQLLQDSFIKMGSGYVRSAVDKMGNPSYQILPTYAPYFYMKPDKLPTVKDSNGKEWDLTDFQALQGKGGPASAELNMMVRLARNQMQTDFKQTFDPEKSENREIAVTMFDPKAMARVAQAAQSALGQLATDPQKMFEFNSADEKGKEAMIESAKNSGYLVGPTVGGTFGTHHFNQFYPILKMKEKYNEIKAEGEALNGNGFANAVGGVVSVATGGIINAKTAAKFMNDNGDVIDTIATVAAVIAAPFTGGASLLVLAAYKAVQGAYAGGVLGAAAGAITGLAAGGQMFGANLEMSYSYADGFGASVGAGVKGVTVGVSYSDQAGFGASISAGVGPLSVGINYSQQGGFGTSVGFKTGNIQVGLSYSEQDGFSGQIGAAGGGMRGGLNYSKADGLGVYAGKMLGQGALSNTTSAEVGWNREKGFQASYGSDEARATFSQKDGFGAKLSGEFAGVGGNLEFTQRGGFSASLSGEIMEGVKGTVSFNSKTGFEASVSGEIAGKNLSLGISEGGKLSFNHSNVGQEESLFINSMDELQSKNDSDIQKAKQAIVEKSFEKYKKTMIELNPDLAEYANDPKKLQDKIKELDEGGNLNHPGDKEKDNAVVDSGQSRDSIFSKVGGAIADLGTSFLGTRVSSGMGYVDEKGVFHQRTCFVAGTKVHTKDGLKNIEDIQVGDEVLSKSDETGEVSYRKVVETFIRQTEAIYTVSFTDGTTLETTWNHPFRVKNQGHALEKFSIETTDWVEAKDLHPGDVALGADGKELVITDITIDEREETVYNFEVAEYHTYFVGEVGVWVHNRGVEDYKILVQAAEAASLQTAKLPPQLQRPLMAGAYTILGIAAVGITGGIIYDSIMGNGNQNDSNGSKNKLQGDPGRYLDVSPIEAEEMRKQGLDPLNRKDVDSYLAPIGNNKSRLSTSTPIDQNRLYPGDPNGTVRNQIPAGWLTDPSNKKNNGTRFYDPKNERGNNIRVMPGNPNSPNPAQQSPYVKWVKDGKVRDVNGNPLKDGDQPEAHIPREQFRMN